jgi:hypothetical protein
LLDQKCVAPAMPPAKLAIDGSLELWLYFWGDWSPHGKPSDIVFEEDLD